ncbi:MAG: integrase, partial [Gammaproteobacteria bacterium HGW-Gammaproteobacteria-8]
MATKSPTSITDEAARRFISENPERATLFCTRITGFHLIKLKRGGSWRFRYTDDTGKRRVATIGAYPALKPATAADKALKWRVDGADPQKEKAERRETAQTEAEAKAARTLAAFLDGPYTRIQARKKGGNATLALIRRNFPELLDRDMASLSARDIHGWQDRREAQGKAHVTIKREFSALKTALNAATRTDPPALESNPLAAVKLQQPVDNDQSRKLAEARHAARRLLTDDEIQRLYLGLDRFADELRAQRRNSREHGKPDLPDLDAVEYPHWFIVFTLAALYTGMRPGDLYTLTWQEASLNFKRITKTPEKTKH